jgi:DNA-directed RNA polymerase subunit RPC12/RpoP
MDTPPERRRILCPYCGKRVLLCKDGRPRVHSWGPWQMACEGSRLWLTKDGRLTRKPASQLYAPAPDPQVACPYCDRTTALRRDGRLRQHTAVRRRGAPWCEGSRQVPRYLTADDEEKTP